MSRIRKITALMISLIMMLPILTVENVYNKVSAVSNEQMIYDFLTSGMGYNSAAACGILANIELESNFNPQLGETGGGGYGLCQWTGSRRTNLINWCTNNGYTYTTLQGQLKFLEYELKNGYKSVYNEMKNAENSSNGAYNVAYSFCMNFEKPEYRNKVHGQYNKNGVPTVNGHYDYFNAYKATYWCIDERVGLTESEYRGKKAINTYWAKYGETIELELDTYYSSYMPLIAYINSSSNIRTYSSNCSTETGWIYPSDECTIIEVYTNGWCKVDYPTPTGNKIGYVPVTNFLCNNSKSITVKTASVKMDTFSRSDSAVNIGCIDEGDNCFIIGNSGNYTQAIYPTPKGKKLGWSLSSDWNYAVPPLDERFKNYMPIKGYTISESNVTVYKNDFTASDGAIYPGDYCEISAIYKNGWCEVTYPTGSGPKTRYVKLSEFIKNTSHTHVKYTAAKQINVYTRENMASSPSWWVSAGDVFFEVSSTSNLLQIMYPIDAQYGGGYKFGWIYKSDVTIPEYKVNYNANGGTGAPAAQTKKYNQSLTLSSAIPSKTGHTFAGWSTSSSGKASYMASAVYNGNADLNLYAVWIPNNYTVSYDLTGGFGAVEKQTKAYGVKMNLSKSVPAKDYSVTIDLNYDGGKIYTQIRDCSFAGWSKNKNPTSADYQAGEEFNENADTILYAVWKNPVIGEIETPVRDGYVFEGWYTHYEGETEADLQKTLTEDITIYALWSEEPVVTTATTKDTTTTTKVTTQAATTTKVTTIATTTTKVTTTLAETAITTVPVTTVSVTESYVLGDVNSDNELNLRDVVILRRYIAGGWDEIINETAADMNSDNEINLKDVVLQRRKIVDGWESAITPIGTYSSFVYGKSESGRELICHSITPQNYDRTILMNFAIHGFEDAYDRDGQVLVNTAEKLIDYYKEYENLSARILLIPSANPDGLLDGTTNNGFGRCNANGIDLNRDFDVNYTSNTTQGRNYTPYAFSASESRALRDLCLEYKPEIVLDFHGWLDYTIGDTELAEVFYQEMGLPHHVSFTDSNASGYFANWAHKQGSLGLLVEFTDDNIPYKNLISALDRIVTGDYDNGLGEYEEDERFSQFDSISLYTLLSENITTYMGFDIPFDTVSYIDGTTDLCTIQKVYKNGWVKVNYPVSSGTKTAYAKLSDFVSEENITDFTNGFVSENTTVYRRSDMTETIGSVWTTDEFIIIAENDNMAQIVYPLDAGGWKMGWIDKNSLV